MSNEELKTIEEIKQLANIIDVSAKELQTGLRNLLIAKESECPWYWIPRREKIVDDVLNCDVSSKVRAEIQRLIADTPTVEDNDVAEQCPECSNLVWLKWDVERDGYTIYCPYCGYRMKLCSMCDVRDGGKCDWNSETGGCKNDKNGRTTETAEPQLDGIQVRTVDDLGRICIPKDIRDKLGIKPGTECAVYSTDELTPYEIIAIRRK